MSTRLGFSYNRGWHFAWHLRRSVGPVFWSRHARVIWELVWPGWDACLLATLCW